jgi:hypothetical protein
MQPDFFMRIVGPIQATSSDAAASSSAGVSKRANLLAVLSRTPATKLETVASIGALSAIFCTIRSTKADMIAIPVS